MTNTRRLEDKLREAQHRLMESQKQCLHDVLKLWAPYFATVSLSVSISQEHPQQQDQ